MHVGGLPLCLYAFYLVTKLIAGIVSQHHPHRPNRFPNKIDSDRRW